MMRAMVWLHVALMPEQLSISGIMWLSVGVSVTVGKSDSQ